jgi:hypothetical protein
MAGEVDTLRFEPVAVGQAPGREAEPDVTAIEQETPRRESESGTEATCQEMPMLQIDPEFKNLIPPLSLGEFEALKENLSLYGCRDRLVVWKDHNILLDGHHRYQICTDLKLPFETRELELSNRAEAKIWIIKNQRGRRNLNESQRAMLAVKLEAVYSEKAKENMGARTDLGQDLGQGEGGRSAEKAAEDMGISHQTVSFAKKVATKGIPELARRVESANVAVSAASKVAALPSETQEKIMQEFKAQIEAGSKPKLAAIIREIVPSGQEAPKDADKLLERFRQRQEAILELIQGIEISKRPENLAKMLAIAERITAKLKEIETKSLDLLTEETMTTEEGMREFALIDEKSKEIQIIKARLPRLAALEAVTQGHIDIRLHERGTKKVHIFAGERKQAKMLEGAPSGMLDKIRKPYVKKVGMVKLTPVQTLDYHDHEILSFLDHWQPIRYLTLLNRLKKHGWSDDRLNMKVTRLMELNLISKKKYRMKNGIMREINVRKLTKYLSLSLTQNGKDKVKSHADTFLERFMSH